MGGSIWHDRLGVLKLLRPHTSMLFNSLEFLVLFMPPTLWMALRARGQGLLAWLALSSAVFYALCGHAWFVVPMLATTVLDYSLALAMERAPRRSTKRALL